MSGSEAVRAAVAERLRAATGRAIYNGPPVQAAFPYGIVETGQETDWGHKSGGGRELRLTVTLRDAGESPQRVRALAAAVEASLADPPAVAGCQLVSLAWLRTRTVREGRAPAVEWTSTVEYRARILELAAEGG